MSHPNLHIPKFYFFINHIQPIDESKMLLQTFFTSIRQIYNAFPYTHTTNNVPLMLLPHYL